MNHYTYYRRGDVIITDETQKPASPSSSGDTDKDTGNNANYQKAPVPTYQWFKFTKDNNDKADNNWSREEVDQNSVPQHIKNAAENNSTALFYSKPTGFCRHRAEYIDWPFSTDFNANAGNNSYTTEENVDLPARPCCG